MGGRENNHDWGKLFYAVILTDRECSFGNVGLNGQRVYSINYKDIGALVSDYPRVDTIKLLRKNLAPYYDVIREAAQRSTTIPARFGQIARDAGEVGLALRRNYAKTRRELDRLDGKVEMGLKVWWNVENPFDYFVERDQPLRARRDQLRAKGPLNRMEQIDFGCYFHERMDRARREIAERVLAALPPGEARLEEVVEDSMIANAGLLIRKDLRKPLEEAVDALGESMGEEYRLKLDGPWPPFSFVDRLELHLSPS